MEILLEQIEVDRLIRKALASEGVTLPPDARFTFRQNHKLGSVRVVYVMLPPKQSR